MTDPYDALRHRAPRRASSARSAWPPTTPAPLVAPTEIIDAQATPQIAARTAYNDAHRIILDDGSSTSYTERHRLAVPVVHRGPHGPGGRGRRASPAPVVLESRNFGSWKIQPQSQVVGKPTGKVAFEQTRPAAPEEVGGDLKLATFNVLNYFTTLGADLTGCSSFKDRAGVPVTVNTCPGSGPRGAWDATNLKRQQDKIVTAINTLDADIVVARGDRELPRCRRRQPRRGRLDPGRRPQHRRPAARAGRSSPSPATLPAGEDVIRTAFIYDPATTELVGDPPRSWSARPPSTTRGSPRRRPSRPRAVRTPTAFAVIANHFKSKGSGTPDPDGQGNANDSRVAQAQRAGDLRRRLRSVARHREGLPDR